MSLLIFTSAMKMLPDKYFMQIVLLLPVKATPPSSLTDKMNFTTGPEMFDCKNPRSGNTEQNRNRSHEICSEFLVRPTEPVVQAQPSWWSSSCVCGWAAKKLHIVLRHIVVLGGRTLSVWPAGFL